MDHGQLGGKGLLGGPGVRLPLADDALTAVGQDGHILRGGKGAQLRDQRGVQRFFHQRFAGAAVHDLAAVVGQDAAALFVQPQVFGQRGDAGGGPAGGQHHGHAAFNGRIQRGAGAGCHFLLVVGQGPVQIQGQHFDLSHIVILFLFKGDRISPSYCTMKRPLLSTLAQMFVEKPVLRGRNARILPDFAAFLPSGRPRPTGFTKALHGAGFGPGQKRATIKPFPDDKKQRPEVRPD